MADPKLRALVSGLTPWFFNKKKNNTLEGHTYPEEASTLDIGSAEKPFRNIYADNISGGGGGGTDELVKVSASDGTAGYLNTKIAGVSPITLASSTTSLINVGISTGTFVLRDGSNSVTGNLPVENGITIDGVDLSNPGNGIEIVSDRYTIDEGDSFTWTGTHQFNVDPQINANLDFIGDNRSITTASTFDLTLAPGGQLTLTPGDNIIDITDMDTAFRTTSFTDSALTGITGFNNYHLSGNVRELAIGSIKTDNLYARFFTADEIRVERGSWILSRSYGIVETDFVVPADEATVDVWIEEAPELEDAKLFVAGNWITARIIDLDGPQILTQIFFQVVDADAGGGNDYIQRQDATTDHLSRQQWRLRRKSGGTTGQTIKKGVALVDLGIVGQGAISMTALSQNDGPYIQTEIFASVSADRPQYEAKTRMGNLKNTIDYVTDVYGFAAGNNLGILPSAGFSGFAVEEDNGLRLFNTDIYLYDGTDIVTSVVRDYGIVLLNDSTLFANDDRNISWYDDLSDIGSAFATARIGTFGGSTDRRLHMESYGSDLSAIFLTASGDGGSNVGSIAVKAGGWNTKATGIVDMTALDVRVIGGGSRLVVGGDTSKFGAAVIQAYEDGATVNANGGIMAEQDGAGDAALRWYLTGVRYYTAGIDNSDGDKWKLSASETLGTGDIIVYDPSTGDVIINGLDLEGSSGTITGLTSSDSSITISGTDIIVNSALYTPRSLSLTAGAGLTGGGDLSANRTFNVGAGSGITVGTDTVSINLAATSGLSVASGLAVGAGDGISVLTNTIAVDSSVVRTSRQVIAGSGLTDGGALSSNVTLNIGAGDGIDVAADSIAVDVTDFIDTAYGLTEATNNIRINLAATSGLEFSSGALQIANSIAGNGLDIASKVMFVGAGNGITVGADSVAVNQAYAFSWTGEHNFADDIIVDTDLFYVNVGTQTIGVGTNSPDSQFIMDIAGAVRAQAFVGPHAIQLKDVAVLLHFDGGYPYETNYSGDNTAIPLGQVSSGSSTTNIYRPGKFYKAAVIGRSATNLSTNPSFETSTANWSVFNNAGGNLTWSRSTDDSYFGDYSAKLEWTAVDNSQFYHDCVSSAVATPYSLGVWMRAEVPCEVVIQIGRANSPFSIYGQATVNVTEEWYYYGITTTTNPDAGVPLRVNIRPNENVDNVMYVDGVQLEQSGYRTPYFDGSMLSAFSWSGTEHLSTSSRGNNFHSYSLRNMVAHRWSAMTWVWIPDESPSSQCGLIYLVGTGGENVNVYTQSNGLWCALNAGGAGTTFPQFATSAEISVGAWHHVAITYSPGDFRIYFDGELAGSRVRTFDNPLQSINIGNSVGNYGAFMVDDVVVSRLTLTDEEVLAIYESEAPVFAESSQFNFRATPKGLVWGDEEGLWVETEDGQKVLGVYAGESATKTWGGFTLEQGDIVFGDRVSGAGAWLHFDRNGSGSGKPDLSIGNGTTETFYIDEDGAYVYNSLEIGTNGYIFGGTKGGYESGVGFFLGYDGGDYKFDIGDAFSYLRWDGSNLIFSGDLVAAGIDGSVVVGTNGSISSSGKGWQTGAGIFMGYNTSGGTAYKLDIGSTTKYLRWDGTNLTISGTVAAGSVQLSTNGYIYGGTKTGYGTGTGVFMGYNTTGGTAYKLDIGDSTNFLRWSGSSLAIQTNNLLGINLSGNSSFLSVTAPAGTFALSISAAEVGFPNTTTGLPKGPRVFASGTWEIDDTLHANRVDIDGQTLRIRTTSNFATSTPGSGFAGEIAWNSSYLYVCISDGNWRRIALGGSW